MWHWDILVLWTLGPWVLGMLGPFNLGPQDFGTFSFLHYLLIILLPPHISSSFFFLPPPTHSYDLVWYGMVWFSMVWYGGVGWWCQMTIEFIHEEISMLFHSEKFHGGWHKRLYTWHKRLCDIAIIASSSRSRSLRDLRLRLLEFTWTRAWQ